MEIDGGYGEVVVMAEEGCSTPKRGIPVRSEPPPPPRKKPLRCCSGKQQPPKNGYFKPPDLEKLFAMRPRPETCV